MHNRSLRIRIRHVAALGLLLVAGVLPRSGARAAISYVSMFRNDSYEQSSDGLPLTDAGSYLALSLNSQAVGEFDTVSATYPGPDSPAALVEQVPTFYHFQTPLLADQATMDAQFPMGTYTFDATNLGGTQSTSFVYDADAYPDSLPYLNGGSYSSLQGMNPAAPMTVHFNPFVVGAGTSEAFLFFTIFDDAAAKLVFDGGFLPATTTELTIPGGTLENNKTYTFELIFSDRVLVPSPGAVFNALLGFDLRTHGTFVTAPEPATAGMVLLGGLLILAAGLRYGRR